MTEAAILFVTILVTLPIGWLSYRLKYYPLMKSLERHLMDRQEKGDG